jgi:hypothetical protein
MREGERRIREGKNTLDETFLFLGGEHHFDRRGLYCWFGAGVACWRMVLVFA